MRLLDAAFEIVGTGGPAPTVRSICRAAALNTRYFYESFGQVDDLVVAVYDRTVSELYGRLREATTEAGPDPRARLRAGISAAVDFVDDDRRRGRILFAAVGDSAALDAHRLAAWRRLLDDIRREPLSPIGAMMLAGGFTLTLVEWLEGRLPMTRGDLVEHVTDSALALALAAPIPTPAGSAQAGRAPKPRIAG